MNPFSAINLLPNDLKVKLVDRMVESVATQAEKLDPKLAKGIRKLSSQAGVREAFETAIETASRRFSEEYSERDEDLVQALSGDAGFWQAKTVQEAVFQMVSRPGSDLGNERDEIERHFEDVLPTRINRERVDRAVIHFLRLVVEQLWTLPGASQIREVYKLQFQRITAESAVEQVKLNRQQLAAMTMLGEDVRQALLQLTGLVEGQLQSEAQRGTELAPAPLVYQNLIPKDYSEFIGREQEIDKLIRFLSPSYGLNIITIDGIGGVGKTSLALEVCYRCLEASMRTVKQSDVPTFDSIVFVSAKQNALTTDGIIPLHQAQRTLQNIFHELSLTLDRPEINQASCESQAQVVRAILARQKSLLVIDNLETIEDKQGILAFLFELPGTVKVIITTRERQNLAPVRLSQLTESQAVRLIQQKASEMDVALDDAKAKSVYRLTGGIPAAMIYTVGQLSAGYSIETVVNRIKDASGDVARFCFQASVEPLRRTIAHYLLMSISIFPQSPIRNAITTTSGCAADPIAAEDGLVKLQRLSLVTQRDERYGILPLTREYAIAELAGLPDFERAARQRWVQWYVDFVNNYGGDAYQHEWHIQYDRLEEEWENIQEVLNWCAEKELYSEFKEVWRNVMAFTRIYGYWSDHLTWSDWMIKSSERRGDLATLIEHLYQKGWTLQRMGIIDETMNTYERAWKLREYCDDLRVPTKLANRIAQTRLLRNEYEVALQWADKAEDIARQIDCESDRKRELIHINYSRALIWASREDFVQAESCLRPIVTESQAMDWQRGIVWTQRLLAEIRIAVGDLGEAEHLLDTHFPIIGRNKDKRGQALYERSFAMLERARGNYSKMHRWATQALDDFKRLGMLIEANEMRKLLEETTI